MGRFSSGMNRREAFKALLGFAGVMVAGPAFGVLKSTAVIEDMLYQNAGQLPIAKTKKFRFPYNLYSMHRLEPIDGGWKVPSDEDVSLHFANELIGPKLMIVQVFEGKVVSQFELNEVVLIPRNWKNKATPKVLTGDAIRGLFSKQS